MTIHTNPVRAHAIDPSTGRPYAIDPATGQPYATAVYPATPIDPRTGQSLAIDPATNRPYAVQLDPRTGQPFVPQIDPNTGRPFAVQPGVIDPATGLPYASLPAATQIDPATGLPFAVQLDPRTGQPYTIDPSTGRPYPGQPVSVQIDPRTGQPYPSGYLVTQYDARTGKSYTVDSRTGQPVAETYPAVDPRTGQPYAVDPNTGRPYPGAFVVPANTPLDPHTGQPCAPEGYPEFGADAGVVSLCNRFRATTTGGAVRVIANEIAEKTDPTVGLGALRSVAERFRAVSDNRAACATLANDILAEIHCTTVNGALIYRKPGSVDQSNGRPYPSTAKAIRLRALQQMAESFASIADNHLAVKGLAASLSSTCLPPPDGHNDTEIFGICRRLSEADNGDEVRAITSEILARTV